MQQDSVKKSTIATNEEAQKKVKSSLRYSVMDGAFYSSMVGFGESFFAAFAAFLKASSFEIGLLGAVPQAIGSITQVFSNKLIKFFNSRKKFVCLAAIMEALIYIPIMLVFFLGQMRIFHLIFFVCLYWVFGMIASSAWSSWMGDLVDERIRGAYFGRRNKIAGLTTFFTFVIGGYILQQFHGDQRFQYIGFVIIFLVALGSRVISFIYLTRMYEPKLVHSPVEDEPFKEFIEHIRHREFGILIGYLLFMNFAVYISSSYFSAYMLYDLKMSYWTFTLLNAISLIVKYLSMPAWGKAADKFGTKRVLTLSAFLMPAVPLLWILSKNLVYLFAVQAFSGLVWGGFELTTFNFQFETTKPEKRATYFAYFNVFNGIVMIVGTLIGGFLISVNHVFWSPILFVFLLSGILRYLASALFIPRLQEIREVEYLPYHELMLRIITTIPTQGNIHFPILFKDNKVSIDIKNGKEHGNVSVGIKKK